MKIQFYIEEELIEEVIYNSSNKLIISNIEEYKKEISSEIFFSNYFYYNFKGKKNNYWKIIDIKLEKDKEIIIFNLKEKKVNKSLKEIALQHEKGIQRFLKKGSLIDVNFGYYKSIIDTNTFNSENNFQSFDKVMFGEMHKTRPCIVLSTYNDLIQVLPLSTKSKNNNLEINIKDIEDIDDFYKENKSYIVPNMIQTVSARRVFPIYSKYNKNLTKNFSKLCINKEDIKKIEKVLSLKFNPYQNKEIKELQNENEKKEKEIINLKEDIALLEELKKMITTDFDIKENSLKKIIEKYKTMR